jgi:hypothetical protein
MVFGSQTNGGTDLVVEEGLDEGLRGTGGAARLALVGADGVEGVYGASAWMQCT